MMKDQFANYIAQKVLESQDDQQRELIVLQIKIQLNALKKFYLREACSSPCGELVVAGG
ncbi:hypothetical protein BHM03_00019805 [Ensete ventricosum]|nr:hypothetical protein BHM03_00019805 [Ensete ventricosum]